MMLVLKEKPRPLLREFSYYSCFSPIRPSNVFLDITDRCQLQCTTCSKWTTPDKMKAEELTTNEWKDTLSHQWKDSKSSLIHLIDKLIRKKQAGFPISNSEAQLRAMRLYIQNPVDILHIKCRVGISNFSIDAYGNVRLCFNMTPIGSIQQYDPKQLWNSGKARLQRAEIRNCKMFCRLLSCNFKP